MNQKKHDKLVKEVEEMNNNNQINIDEQKNIAYDLGQHRGRIINMVKRSDTLTQLILARENKIEFKLKKINAFNAKKKDS